jgi:HPt (histidine-containing phosphotransfer) domain-containing protein
LSQVVQEPQISGTGRDIKIPGRPALIDVFSAATDHVASPPLVPSEQPIDLTHLYRMTLGDHSLEREVLQLFEQQADMLIGRMPGLEPAGAAALAHTLKGSARGIGAWRVARAAEMVEQSAATGGADLPRAIDGLAMAARDAHRAITDLLRGR